MTKKKYYLLLYIILSYSEIKFLYQVYDMMSLKFSIWILKKKRKKK